MVAVGKGRGVPGWPHRARAPCARDMPPLSLRARAPAGAGPASNGTPLRRHGWRPKTAADAGSRQATSTVPHKKRAARKPPERPSSPFPGGNRGAGVVSQGRDRRIAADACADSVPFRRAFRISTPATSPQHSLRKPRFRRPFGEQGNTRGNRPTEAAVRVHDAVGTHGACRGRSRHRHRVGHRRGDVARSAQRDPHRSSRDGLLTGDDRDFAVVASRVDRQRKTTARGPLVRLAPPDQALPM